MEPDEWPMHSTGWSSWWQSAASDFGKTMKEVVVVAVAATVAEAVLAGEVVVYATVVVMITAEEGAKTVELSYQQCLCYY